MLDQPKILNYPGIDQPLREQTLAEFVMVLDENHLVRRELRELQRRSAEAARLSAENVTLMNRIKELEADLSIYKIGLPQTPAEIANAAAAMLKATPEPHIIEKIPCRLGCGASIARGKSYWSIHLKKKHPNVSPLDMPQE